MSASDAAAGGWLNGKAAVACFTFDVDGESAILAEGRRYADHPQLMSHQAYGPKVAVPRILELLDDCGIESSFFVPGFTAERYPRMIERILEAGHEVGHHSYSHRAPTTLEPGEERADFERALEALDRFGVRPVGHRTALWATTWETAELVAEYGLLYESNLMDDDRPYILETAKGSIVELPPHWSLDDWAQYAYYWDPPIGQNIDAPEKVVSLWTGELDAMRRHGCLFMLTNHPFLSGRPSRIEALRLVIEHALGCGDVDVVTAEQVARRAHADPSLRHETHEPVEVDPAIYPR